MAELQPDHGCWKRPADIMKRLHKKKRIKIKQRSFSIGDDGAASRNPLIISSTLSSQVYMPILSRLFFLFLVAGYYVTLC